MPMLERPISRAGWMRVAFGDVVRKVNDKVDPWDSGLERYVAGEHMDSDDLRIRRWGLIGDDYLGPAFHMRFKPGQVLYGSRRTYLRKVALADFEGITANTTFVLETKDPTRLMAELLPFLMQTEAFHSYSIKHSKGSVNPYINFSDLEVFEFLLPPIQEQARLVEALTACIAYLEGLATLAASSKSALGALSKSLSDFGRLTPLGDLVEAGLVAPPQDGNHGEKHPKASDYVGDGIPFVMASDLLGGAVDFARCKKIPRTLADSLRIGFAERGDVLLSHKGTVGEVAYLAQIPTDYVMLTPQLTYYRTLDRSRLEPMWLFYCFLSPDFQMQLRRFERQSTRAYVGITAQRELKIPVCDVTAQRDLLKKLALLAAAQSHAAGRRLKGLNLYSRMLVEVFAS
jgi:type I restriction enzyme S subunit